MDVGGWCALFPAFRAGEHRPVVPAASLDENIHKCTEECRNCTDECRSYLTHTSYQTVVARPSELSSSALPSIVTA